MPYLWAASVFFASLIMENFLFKILKKIMNLIEYKILTQKIIFVFVKNEKKKYLFKKKLKIFLSCNFS